MVLGVQCSPLISTLPWEIRLCPHQSGCRGPHLNWILPFLVSLPASSTRRCFRGPSAGFCQPASHPLRSLGRCCVCSLDNNEQGRIWRPRWGRVLDKPAGRWGSQGAKTGKREGDEHGVLPGCLHTCLRQAHHSLQEPCAHFTDGETGTQLSHVPTCQGQGGNTRALVPASWPKRPHYLKTIQTKREDR